MYIVLAVEDFLWICSICDDYELMHCNVADVATFAEVPPRVSFASVETELRGG